MISSLSKQTIRKITRKLGFELSRFSESPAVLIASWLKAHSIGVVLDIGAHAGQFCTSVRAAGYQGRFLSFEPAAEPFEALARNAQGDPNWQVRRLAIGDTDGDIVLNIAGNEGGSSSVLPMLEEHRCAAPKSAYVRTEIVPCARLDSVAPKEGQLFLKVDVQGYENAVFEGAQATMRLVQGVHVELSLTPLYAGQDLMNQTMTSLIRAGFEPWAFFPTFSDPKTHRMFQVDGVFFRS